MKKLLLAVILLLNFALTVTGPKAVPLDPNKQYFCRRATNSFADPKDNMECGTFAGKDWEQCKKYVDEIKTKAQEVYNKATAEAKAIYKQASKKFRRSQSYGDTTRAKIGYEKAEKTYNDAIAGPKAEYDKALTPPCVNRRAWIITDETGKVHCGTCGFKGSGDDSACVSPCVVAQPTTQPK